MLIQLTPLDKFHQKKIYVSTLLLPTTVPTQRQIKSDSLNYVVTNEHQLKINTQEKISNIRPCILLVILGKLQSVILHVYYNTALGSHQGTWEFFLTR